MICHSQGWILQKGRQIWRWGYRWLAAPWMAGIIDFQRHPKPRWNHGNSQIFYVILLGCSNLGNLFIYCMLHSQQTLTNRFLGMGSEAMGKHWKCMKMLGSNRAHFGVKFHETMWAPHLILFLKGFSDGDLAETPSTYFSHSIFRSSIDGWFCVLLRPKLPEHNKLAGTWWFHVLSIGLHSDSALPPASFHCHTRECSYPIDKTHSCYTLSLSLSMYKSVEAWSCIIIVNYTYVSCHDAYNHESATLPWPLLEDFARERPLCLGAYGGLGQGGTWTLDLTADVCH